MRIANSQIAVPLRTPLLNQLKWLCENSIGSAIIIAAVVHVENEIDTFLNALALSVLQLDDTALQLYKGGDYGAYLDLEASINEQQEEFEGFHERWVYLSREIASVQLYFAIRELPFASFCRALLFCFCSRRLRHLRGSSPLTFRMVNLFKLRVTMGAIRVRLIAPQDTRFPAYQHLKSG